MRSAPRDARREEGRGRDDEGSCGVLLFLQRRRGESLCCSLRSSPVRGDIVLNEVEASRGEPRCFSRFRFVSRALQAGENSRSS